MKRAAVASSSIAAIGYDPRRRALEVEFRDSGDVYRYFGVSAAEHAAFISAESKGIYLNQVFKPQEHPYVIVRRGQGWQARANLGRRVPQEN